DTSSTLMFSCPGMDGIFSLCFCGVEQPITKRNRSNVHQAGFFTCVLSFGFQIVLEGQILLEFLQGFHKRLNSRIGRYSAQTLSLIEKEKSRHSVQPKPGAQL